MPSTILDSAVFRNIFTTEPMRAVWSDENRVQKYLDFEAALAVAQARLGIIPQKACDEIVKHCSADKIDMAKLKEATERIGYPVLPVVQQLVKLCKDGLGEWSHWGATTQDITDTATIMQIREALALVEKEIDGICDALAALAKKYRDTPMAGRSNLQQAVPITFGYKMATMLAAFERHKQRLQELKARVLVGEFGGAAGTLSSLGKDGLKVQAELMKELKLGQPAISWHTVRDTIAEVGAFLGLVGGSLGKIAMDVKLMMQTEVAQRIAAQPRTKEYGILSVFLQYYCTSKIQFSVSKNSFFPVPSVSSTIVHLDFTAPYKTRATDDRIFRRVVRGTFGTRRKTLRNGLRNIGVPVSEFERLSVDLELRPEELSVGDFVTLANELSHLGGAILTAATEESNE